jgi:NO-binding membrane sensor protein with MHYT domain
MVLTGTMMGESIDTTHFIKMNNLEKHFDIVEDKQ